jgi:hypothetical protein
LRLKLLLVLHLLCTTSPLFELCFLSGLEPVFLAHLVYIHLDTL